jgi:hypothetical protein
MPSRGGELEMDAQANDREIERADGARLQAFPCAAPG